MRINLRHIAVYIGLLAAAALFTMQVATAASIVGSKHDFSSGGTSTYKGPATADGGQVCVYCHTPHNASTSQPLWNHTASGVASYTLYTNSTLNATAAQPGAVSKLCLSCHDGTVAIDSFGTFAGTATNKIATSSVNNLGGTAGTDLSNDHPIGFAYNAALATADGGGLVSPASASQVVAGIPLFSSTLECASCHSVHDSTNAPFLRVANTGSALCLKCHTK